MTHDDVGESASQVGSQISGEYGNCMIALATTRPLEAVSFVLAHSSDSSEAHGMQMLHAVMARSSFSAGCRTAMQCQQLCDIPQATCSILASTASLSLGGQLDRTGRRNNLASVVANYVCLAAT